MRVTHPFHPLRGQEFEYVSRRLAWGEPRVDFYDAEGRLRTVPVGWTDVDPPDLFEVCAAGRCPFRTDDLVRLALLVREIEEARSVSETTPYV